MTKQQIINEIKTLINNNKGIVIIPDFATTNNPNNTMELKEWDIVEDMDYEYHRGQLSTIKKIVKATKGTNVLCWDEMSGYIIYKDFMGNTLTQQELNEVLE